MLAGTDDRLFVRRIVDLLTGARPTRRQRRAHPRTRRRSRRRATACGDRRGAVVALDPTTGAILAHGQHPVVRPERACRPRRRGDPRGLRRSSTPTRPSRCSTARCARPTRPARRSRSSPRRRRWRPAQYTAGQRGRRGADARPAADRPRSCRTSAAAPCSGERDDHARRRARAVLQHRVRPARASSSAPTRCATQAEKFGFDETRFEVPMPRRRQRLPGATSTRRRPRCPRSASSTSAPPRCRWRWSSPAIANDGVLMKPYLVEEVLRPTSPCSSSTEPAGAARGGLRRRPPRSLTAMMDRGRRATAPAPTPQIDGRHGGRQDRHRAAGAEGRPPHAWFICFAPAERPAGRGRGRHRGRRRRRPRSAAAGWPRRSPRPSWRRCWADDRRRPTRVLGERYRLTEPDRHRRHGRGLARRRTSVLEPRRWR